MTEDEYHTKAKEAIGSCFWEQYGEMIKSWKAESNKGMLTFADEQLARTIADENIENSYIYLGENGDLYVISAIIYALAGSHSYFNVINVSNYTLAADYTETIPAN